ncbi:MAG: hypothetical protein ACRENP_12590 [Longimicrobiales bacterium]
MTVSGKRAALLLLVASSTWAPSDYLIGQEPRGAIDVLFTFVREDARKAVPPEMRPYNIRRMFLMVSRNAPGRDALGPLDKRNLERLGVTLVDDTAGPASDWRRARHSSVLVLDSVGPRGSLRSR